MLPFIIIVGATHLPAAEIKRDVALAGTIRKRLVVVLLLDLVGTVLLIRAGFTSVAQFQNSTWEVVPPATGVELSYSVGLLRYPILFLRKFTVSSLFSVLCLLFSLRSSLSLLSSLSYFILK